MELGWELILGALGTIGAVLGWTGRLQNRISSGEKDLSEFKVRSAETYVTKSDLAVDQAALTIRLDRIEQKLDDLLKMNGHRK